MIISIAHDFSETPGGRNIEEGPFSGEFFRDKVLIPKYLLCKSNGETLIIDFDGTYGYSSGFLEETFGGMVRKGYNPDEILDNMFFLSSDDPSVAEDIIKYVQMEKGRQRKREK